MQLKFYARDDLKVTEPGVPRLVGVPSRYVGRQYVGPTATEAASHPATKEPFACDSESSDGQRLRLLCSRDASLWPADKETAAFCGVPFVDVEFSSGNWSAKRAAKSPASKE